MIDLQAFGPIMPIMKFSSDEEAVKLANDSKYGLGCAVFSGSQRRARKIASQIVCGVAAINDFASNYMCQVNFSFRGLLICYVGSSRVTYFLNFTLLISLKSHSNCK